MQRSAKKPPMGSTWRTSHWWLFLLAAADDPLSQEIKMGDHPDYHPSEQTVPLAVADKLAAEGQNTQAVVEPDMMTAEEQNKMAADSQSAEEHQGDDRGASSRRLQSLLRSA